MPRSPLSYPIPSGVVCTTLHHHLMCVVLRTTHNTHRTARATVTADDEVLLPLSCVLLLQWMLDPTRCRPCSGQAPVPSMPTAKLAIPSRDAAMT